jgi:hypothetical protein
VVTAAMRPDADSFLYESGCQIVGQVRSRLLDDESYRGDLSHSGRFRYRVKIARLGLFAVGSGVLELLPWEFERLVVPANHDAFDRIHRSWHFEDPVKRKSTVIDRFRRK